VNQNKFPAFVLLTLFLVGTAVTLVKSRGSREPRTQNPSQETTRKPPVTSISGSLKSSSAVNSSNSAPSDSRPLEELFSRAQSEGLDCAERWQKAFKEVYPILQNRNASSFKNATVALRETSCPDADLALYLAKRSPALHSLLADGKIKEAHHLYFQFADIAYYEDEIKTLKHFVEVIAKNRIDPETRTALAKALETAAERILANPVDASPLISAAELLKSAADLDGKSTEAQTLQALLDRFLTPFERWNLSLNEWIEAYAKKSPRLQALSRLQQSEFQAELAREEAFRQALIAVVRSRDSSGS